MRVLAESKSQNNNVNMHCQVQWGLELLNKDFRWITVWDNVFDILIGIQHILIYWQNSRLICCTTPPKNGNVAPSHLQWWQTETQPHFMKSFRRNLAWIIPSKTHLPDWPLSLKCNCCSSVKTLCVRSTWERVWHRLMEDKGGIIRFSSRNKKLLVEVLLWSFLPKTAEREPKYLSLFTKIVFQLTQILGFGFPLVKKWYSLGHQVCGLNLQSQKSFSKRAVPSWVILRCPLDYSAYKMQDSPKKVLKYSLLSPSI